jgi:hypothetical protein
MGSFSSVNISKLGIVACISKISLSCLERETYSANSILSPTGAQDDELNKHRRRERTGTQTNEMYEKLVIPALAE